MSGTEWQTFADIHACSAVMSVLLAQTLLFCYSVLNMRWYRSRDLPFSVLVLPTSLAKWLQQHGHWRRPLTPQNGTNNTPKDATLDVLKHW
eukprot:573063-Amphidinium_carterae.2